MKKLDAEVKMIILKMIVAVGVAALIFVGLFAYSRFLSNVDKTVELGTDDENYRFTYDVSKSWSEIFHGYAVGEQIDMAIENRSQSPMSDWTIVLKMMPDCRIDSYWNGEYYYDVVSNLITITSLEYNDTVESGEVQPFGMVLYAQDKFPIESGKFLYHEEKKMTELPAFWVVVVLLGIILVSGVNGIFFKIRELSLEAKQKESLRIINQSLITFANTIDAKDSYTKGHSQRVAWYSRELARRMGQSEEFCQNIFYVGLLHDIGKIGVQDAILKKNAKLTYDEFNEIKEHTSMGGDILRGFTAIPGIEAGARYHHEKFDGSGYMAGLKGEEIPLLARIITVADSFDAMSSARCYRSAMDLDAIIAEVKRCSGSQFDPDIVPHMINMIDEDVAPVELADGQLEKELEALL